jgi:hypothetical protein
MTLLYYEEHFFTVVMLYKKYYEVQFEDLSHKVKDFFPRTIKLMVKVLCIIKFTTSILS